MRGSNWRGRGGDSASWLSRDPAIGAQTFLALVELAGDRRISWQTLPDCLAVTALLYIRHGRNVPLFLSPFPIDRTGRIPAFSHPGVS
jgi:hypothetical protein